MYLSQSSSFLPTSVSLLPPPNQLFRNDGIPMDILACGGYFFPSTSTLGSQVHRWSSGMLAKTLGRWPPQPLQDFLAVCIAVVETTFVLVTYALALFPMLVGEKKFLQQVEQVAAKHMMACTAYVMIDWDLGDC